ncbi:Uncharacterised protein [Vibrio cholerae]|nr:Uncharacterised protein [Vibrio cholerae]
MIRNVFGLFHGIRHRDTETCVLQHVVIVFRISHTNHFTGLNA